MSSDLPKYFRGLTLLDGSVPSIGELRSAGAQERPITLTLPDLVNNAGVLERRDGAEATITITVVPPARSRGKGQPRQTLHIGGRKAIVFTSELLDELPGKKSKWALVRNKTQTGWRIQPMPASKPAAKAAA